FLRSTKLYNTFDVLARGETTMLRKLLFFGLVLASISLNAFALEETIGDFTFTYTVSDNEATITHYAVQNAHTTFTVPATLGGYPVVYLAITGGSGSGFSMFDVTSFVIPSTVISIANLTFLTYSEWYKNRPSGYVYLGKVLVEYNGTPPANISVLNDTLGIEKSVFSGHPTITAVELPQSLKYIGSSAFSGCSGIPSISLPDNIKIISASAFSGCSRIQSLVLPSSLKTLGGSAFYGCTALTNDLILPNGVTQIGVSAFQDCSLLRSVKISDSVTTLSSSAFSGCTSLSLAEIGANVAVIEGSAFYNCANLSFISLPASVASIASSAFSNCTKLKQVYCFPSVAPGGTGNIFTSSPQIHVLSSASGYTIPTWRGGTITTDLENCPLVSFDSQGGTFISPQYFPCGKPYGTLPQPVKNGYLFLGWHTQPMGDGERIKSTLLSPQTAVKRYTHSGDVPKQSTHTPISILSMRVNPQSSMRMRPQLLRSPMAH
ncbi:MAG: leucine-rich repeat protein, partial [Kiritimatiellae bacterium]|nr:leucine-rich repeat protein [Kiritimatiellia bacterium]